ncbi:MAG: HNH endonuclease signature motif containing protein [Actinomycetota bacterium]
MFDIKAAIPDRAEVKAALAIVQDLAHRLRPEELDAEFAKELVVDFAKMEHSAAAAKALAARRVSNSGSWRLDGDRSAAGWMARRTGSSEGNAIAVLETANRLSGLSATDEAVRSGELSEVQAIEIASAASARPSSEKELLEVAKFEGVKRLKEHCNKVKAAAAGDERGRYESIRRTRYLRTWSDHMGAFCLEAKLTPDAGASLLAALEPFKREIAKQASKLGRKEPDQAWAADALVAMAAESKSGAASGSRGPASMVHVMVDHSALVRGSVEGEQTCEIPGVGPVPVSTARLMLNDCFLAVLVTDGVDIKAVAHKGRVIPSKLRTALEARDPVCVVPGCGQRKRLEIDHIVPMEKGGPTCLPNLARLCAWHHYLKTHQGHNLLGGPGNFTLEPPGSARGSPHY